MHSPGTGKIPSQEYININIKVVWGTLRGLCINMRTNSGMWTLRTRLYLL